jgi:hypothetical protein
MYVFGYYATINYAAGIVEIAHREWEIQSPERKGLAKTAL